jgi:hypothetical protein
MIWVKKNGRQNSREFRKEKLNGKLRGWEQQIVWWVVGKDNRSI